MMRPNTALLPAILSLCALSALFAVGAPALGQNPLGGKGQGSNPLAQSVDPLAGEWRGDGLVVVFTAKGRSGSERKARYEGTIRLGEASFPMDCTRSDSNALRGTFRVDGERYSFTGELAPDALTLESEGTRYRLTAVGKAAAKNPLGGGPASSAAAAAAAGDKAPLRMKAFTHPRGFKFQHPEGWEVQAAEEGIAVLPAGVERDESGQPLEMFIISGEEAEGVQRPDQPEVLQWFDSQMAQMFPKMKRGGSTDALESLLGPGAILRYSGETPTGLDGQADVYVTLHRGMGLFMLHLGRKDLVEAHAAEARRMFSSFGWTKGQVDPNLVGLWHRNETSQSSSLGIEGGIDMVGSSTNRYWEFLQDGSVVYTSGTRIYGDVGDVSLYDGGANPNEWRGVWSVQGDRVTVQWNGGGVEQYEYSVFAHVDNQTALKLTVPGEEKGDYYIRQ